MPFASIVKLGEIAIFGHSFGKFRNFLIMATDNLQKEGQEKITAEGGLGKSCEAKKG